MTIVQFPNMQPNTEPDRNTQQNLNKVASDVVCIRLNNVATNDPCAICGQRTDPDISPELFAAGTYSLVCYDCGMKYAPDVMQELSTLKYEWARTQYGQYVTGDEKDEMLRNSNHTVEWYLAGKPSDPNWQPAWLTDDSAKQESAKVKVFVQNDSVTEAKRAALEHYAEVDSPRHYFQIDGWVNAEGHEDSALFPNRERYALSGTTTDELWRMDIPVRVHILQGTTQADAIELLERALKWVKNDWNMIGDWEAYTQAVLENVLDNMPINNKQDDSSFNDLPF